MRILHTRLRVSDMKKSVEFYTQTLKLRVVRETLSPRGFPLVFLQGIGNDVELELVQLPGRFSVPEDLFHIALAVGDIKQFEKLLTDGPTKTSSGNVIGFIADPDGYEIELIQKNE